MAWYRDDDWDADQVDVEDGRIVWRTSGGLGAAEMPVMDGLLAIADPAQSATLIAQQIEAGVFGDPLEGRDVARVRLARQLQQLGLTVGEIVDALAAHDVGGATCTSERWRLEQVAARVEAQLAELRRTRRSIRDALAACDQGHCRLSDESAG